jgi:hypothetical protein
VQQKEHNVTTKQKHNKYLISTMSSSMVSYPHQGTKLNALPADKAHNKWVLQGGE